MIQNDTVYQPIKEGMIDVNPSHNTSTDTILAIFSHASTNNHN